MFTAEDYQSLFQELGGSEADNTTSTTSTDEQKATATPASSTTPASATPESSDSSKTSNLEATSFNKGDAENKSEEENKADKAGAQDANDEDAQKQAKAFAEMRSTISKYSKVFKKLQPLMGVDSEDAVIERLLDAGLNAQARDQKVDPSLLKRMQALEDQNLSMLQKQRESAIVESFGLLQKDFNLTNAEVMDFAKELDSKQIDVMKVGVDLSTLYRGMHHEAITKKEIEAAKQKWIEEDANASKAPGVNTASGKKSEGSTTKINTMGELENLFNSLDVRF